MTTNSKNTEKKDWKKENVIKYATWNVRGISHKEEELDKILHDKEIKIAVITETKKKLKGTKETNNYTVIYSGVKQTKRAQAGVMIWIHKSISKNISHYTYWNERIIETRMKIGRGNLTFLGVYAPEEGREDENDKFYNKLQEILNKINNNDYIIIAGDINARIGNEPIQNTVGKYGESVTNKNGIRLRDFVTFNNFKIMNSFYNHKDIHSFTWSSRNTKTIIDYFVANQKAADVFLDVRVFRGCNIDSDHHLLMAKLRFPPKWLHKPQKTQTKPEPIFRYKIKLLNDESIRWLYEQRINKQLTEIEEHDDIEIEWINIKNILNTAANESLGKYKLTTRKRKLKLWDDEMKNIVEQKNSAYQKYLQTKTLTDEIEYKRHRAIVRRESRKRQRKSWEEFTNHLESDMYKVQPKIYKIIKHMNKEIKEVANINIGPSNKDFQNYYHKLWTEEVEDDTIHEESSMVDNENEGELDIGDLLIAFEKLKNRKSPGEDNINAELYKYAGNRFHERLLRFYNKIYNRAVIPKEWKTSIVLPIFKKGDKQKVENYRGISLLNTCYKIYSKILNEKLKKETENFILECQNGFRKGRSCIDPLFCMKLIIEKRREFNLETHLAFIDFEKAFDNVKRKLLFAILKKRKVPNMLLQNIIEIYSENKIVIKTNNTLSEEISINKGVRQGCPLSPTLFNIYMNEMILKWNQQYEEGIKISRNSKLNTLIFADDQAIIANSEDSLQRGIFKLKNTATEFGLTISPSKSKVMAFIGQNPKRSKIVINDRILEQVNTFKYLGCSLSYITEKDINQKITSFTKVSGIINKILNPNIVQKSSRTKIYNTLALPVLLYGSEIWTIKQKDRNRLRSTEMKFHRRTAGYTLFDHKRNEEILEELNVKSTEVKIKNYKDRWLQHVSRMNNSRTPRQMIHYRPTGRRRLGRPMKRLLDEADTGLFRPSS